MDKKEKMKLFKIRVTYMKDKLKGVLQTYKDCYPIDDEDTCDWELRDHLNRIDQMVDYFEYQITDVGLWN